MLQFLSKNNNPNYKLNSIVKKLDGIIKILQREYEIISKCDIIKAMAFFEKEKSHINLLNSINEELFLIFGNMKLDDEVLQEYKKNIKEKYIVINNLIDDIRLFSQGILKANDKVIKAYYDAKLQHMIENSNYNKNGEIDIKNNLEKISQPINLNNNI